ncbi:TetR/AcrR family transcriptional regulator [Winogradskya consettensis]|uniref:TetR family transcriptional regulator n=1 Tax=Winogradskya consettensis TaxID=113560 RepID=A0A919T169_9ACTN|nr:TetR/AcrR family transcriptional regulator [Actinoplanes consettensis]GIM81948.1 TetR family transcriptional regulator [Actinoplanes consettensis]
MTLADHPSPAPRPGRRADAERNRAVIIEAAGEVFAECGGGVDVREIARRSGVGMGTLYRHFPTKDELLATVLERQFNAWLTDAHQQAMATEDPWRALAGFFEQTLSTQARNRAVVESFTATGGPSDSCIQRCYSIIDELRTRCVDAGILRPGVTTEDLFLLSGSLSQAVLTTADSRPGQWRRLLRISLDGLSSRNTESLPEH